MLFFFIPGVWSKGLWVWIPTLEPNRTPSKLFGIRVRSRVHSGFRDSGVESELARPLLRIASPRTSVRFRECLELRL